MRDSENLLAKTSPKHIDNSPFKTRLVLVPFFAHTSYVYAGDFLWHLTSNLALLENRVHFITLPILLIILGILKNWRVKRLHFLPYLFGHNRRRWSGKGRHSQLIDGLSVPGGQRGQGWCKIQTSKSYPGLISNNTSAINASQGTTSHLNLVLLGKEATVGFWVRAIMSLNTV